MYFLYPAIQQRIRGTENGSVFIGKDCLVKCLSMLLLIFELINHVNNFTALVVNFTDTVVVWDHFPAKSIAVTDKKITSMKTKFKNASKNILHKI